MKATLALLAGVAAASAVVSDVQERAPCYQGLKFFALGGQQTTEGDLGYLQSLADSAMAAIPNSNLEQVPYTPGADVQTAMAEATPSLRQKIIDYSNQCPGHGVGLLGYSVGGMINMNVLCGDNDDGSEPLDNDYRKVIVSNIVYGDLTFIPNLRYTRGTCEIGSSRPRAFPGYCFPYGRKTISYCDVDDVECCSGTSQEVHFSYPKYDGEATEWLKERFAQWQQRRRNDN